VTADVRRVPAGQAPLPLYSYVIEGTLLVVNRGTVSVYVARDATVDSARGMELPPLASMVVDGGDSWWVVADPAAGATSQLVVVVPQGITYTAGAAEIAAAIAAAGIFIRDEYVQLAALTTTANTDSIAAALDVATYQSVVLAAGPGNTGAVATSNATVIELEWDWEDTAGNNIFVERYSFPLPEVGGFQQAMIRLPVRAPHMSLSYQYLGAGTPAGPYSWTLYGSFRATPKAEILSRGDAADNQAEGGNNVLFAHTSAFGAGATKSAWSYAGNGPAILAVGVRGAGTFRVQVQHNDSAISGTTGAQSIFDRTLAGNSDQLFELDPPNGPLWIIMTSTAAQTNEVTLIKAAI
jgi:hypothetical protein